MSTLASTSAVPFPCTKCGACCKMLNDPRAPEFFRTSGLALPDGRCKHLQADNSCGIYDTRPLPCNFARIYRESGLVNILPEPVWNAHVAQTSCRVSVDLHGGEVPDLRENVTPWGWVIWQAVGKLLSTVR